MPADKQVISSLELARICGVSQGTIDRALHDRPGIAEKTRERILAAAAEHGYLPNPAAREMLAGKRSMVGVIVPALHTMYFWDLVLELKEACAPHQVPFHTVPVSSSEEFIQAVTEFASRRVRGLIMIPPEPDISLPNNLLKGIRAISLFTPLADKQTCSLQADEFGAGRDAAEYLIKQGHETILHSTLSRQLPTVQERADGYKQAMQDHQLKPIICTDSPVDNIAALIEKHRPTAFFAFNDWQALTIIRALHQNSIRVPADIAVMGVDASPGFTELAPGITSMAFPGKQAAQLCAKHIFNTKPLKQIKPLQYTLSQGQTA